MKNPWINYNFNESIFHEADKDIVEKFNLSAKEDVRYSDKLLPEPYIGNLDAKVLLLALNPGLSPDDFKTHENEKYIEFHRQNIDQVNSDIPFYYLNQKLNCPGSLWWHGKLRWLIEKTSISKVSNTLYCLQLVPYHSRSFKKSSKPFPTQKFVKAVIEKHIEKDLPIIIMRSKKLWIDLVPSLLNYKKITVLRNPRNPTLSPRNLGQENFDDLVKIIK